MWGPHPHTHPPPPHPPPPRPPPPPRVRYWYTPHGHEPLRRLRNTCDGREWSCSEKSARKVHGDVCAKNGRTWSCAETSARKGHGEVCEKKWKRNGSPLFVFASKPFGRPAVARGPPTPRPRQSSPAWDYIAALFARNL